MTDTHTTEQSSLAKSVTTKVLAIIGFVATCALVFYLILVGVTRAPGSFDSLASLAKSIGDYRPIEKLEVTPKQTVVNSEESFDMTWTDMNQPGTYHVTYTCTDGISILVRAADGKLVPMKCTDTLSLPHTVQGLFLSITSGTNRFADVPFSVRFANEAGKDILTGNTKVTVVNAQIPVGGVAVDDTKKEEIPKKETPKPETPKTETPKSETPVTTPKPAPKPVVTTIIPTSNPNGNVDLAVTMLGSGVISQGAFVFTPSYDRDFENVIKFKVKNIGTKTSDSWTVSTNLPNGQMYESEKQKPLKPEEYAEFTIGFTLEDSRKDLVTIHASVKTNSDIKNSNNSASWSVVVQD